MEHSKKLKKPKSKSEEHSKAPVQEGSAPSHQETLKSALKVGILGWNLPRFMESHSGFIEQVKRNIASQEGVPVFYGVSGGSGAQEVLPGSANGNKSGFHTNYGLPSRDMIADQIEILAQEEGLHEMVMVPWSVNSAVGMLMAAVRCGIPVVFLPCYFFWDRLENAPYSRCSMALLLEVLGLAKIGALGRYLSGRADKKEEFQSLPEFAQWSSDRVVELGKNNITPRRFFSQSAFQNALAVDLALGGSAETVLHLCAIAREAEVALPLALVDETSRKVPQLVPMNKEGEFPLSELEKLGGLPSLLGALQSFLQPSPMILSRNIVEIARENAGGRAPLKWGHPHRKSGSIVLVAGNAASEGALFRTAGLKEQWLSGSLTVKVFDTESSCVDAVSGRKIKKGDLIVLRYCGPKGNPGMPPLTVLKNALEEKGLEDQVAVFTDGRPVLSGKTPAFVHVSPEAAVGGVIAVLQDGDRISWNSSDRNISVRLTDTEIKVRLSRWHEQRKTMKNSFLYRYSKYASSSSLGATLS